MLFVSLEQSRDELVERFLCTATGLSSEQVNDENMPQQWRDLIADKLNCLANLPLWIDDKTPRPVSQIASLARIHRRRDKIGLLIVDYLQLIAPEDKKAHREQQVSENSRGLKMLARSLGIPVIALAQLNRESEKRVDKRPLLSDLRESGAIEQDADVVVFLDRPATYQKGVPESEAWARVAKHRNGKPGDVRLYWHAETMQFRDAAPAHAANGGGF